MVASPSDVDRLRKCALETIQNWNIDNARRFDCALIPLLWERSSTPAFGAHPQDLINQQLLADADILIAIFGSKLGTKTIEYESGTDEEIQKHNKLGKRVMVYFSDERRKVSTLDENQLKRLRKYKKQIASKCLYETVTSKSDFEKKLTRQLTKVVEERIPKNSSAVVALGKRDQALLKRTFKLIHPDGAESRFLKNADLGFKFRSEVMSALWEFGDRWIGTIYEYDDPALEESRKVLHSAIREFNMELAINSVIHQGFIDIGVDDIATKQQLAIRDRLNELATKAHLALCAFAKTAKIKYSGADLFPSKHS